MLPRFAQSAAAIELSIILGPVISALDAYSSVVETRLTKNYNKIVSWQLKLLSSLQKTFLILIFKKKFLTQALSRVKKNADSGYKQLKHSARVGNANGLRMDSIDYYILHSSNSNWDCNLFNTFMDKNYQIKE